MAYTDANGIVRVEVTDNISPLHPVLNSIASSVSDRFDADIPTYRVSNVTQRTSLVAEANPSVDRPLFVWRANAQAGLQLEYTTNGADWYTIRSSEFTGDSGWVPVTKYNSGLSGSLKARRIDDVVYVSGVISGTVGNGVTVLCPPGALATKFRPVDVQFGAAYLGGGYPATAYVRANGSIVVTQRTGSNKNNPQMTISFLQG